MNISEEQFQRYIKLTNIAKLQEIWKCRAREPCVFMRYIMDKLQLKQQAFISTLWRKHLRFVIMYVLSRKHSPVPSPEKFFPRKATLYRNLPNNAIFTNVFILKWEPNYSQKHEFIFKGPEQTQEKSQRLQAIKDCKQSLLFLALATDKRKWGSHSKETRIILSLNSSLKLVYDFLCYC